MPRFFSSRIAISEFCRLFEKRFCPLTVIFLSVTVTVRNPEKSLTFAVVESAVVRFDAPEVLRFVAGAVFRVAFPLALPVLFCAMLFPPCFISSPKGEFALFFDVGEIPVFRDLRPGDLLPIARLCPCFQGFSRRRRTHLLRRLATSSRVYCFQDIALDGDTEKSDCDVQSAFRRANRNRRFV